MNDRISRKALLKEMDKLYQHHLEMGNYAADGATADCMELVRNAPAVEAEPKQGRWSFKWDAEKDPKKLFVRIVCSECNLHTGQKSNYCPNCGAKMDLEANND